MVAQPSIHSFKLAVNLQHFSKEQVPFFASVTAHNYKFAAPSYWIRVFAKILNHTRSVICNLYSIQM